MRGLALRQCRSINRSIIVNYLWWLKWKDTTCSIEQTRHKVKNSLAQLNPLIDSDIRKWLGQLVSFQPVVEQLEWNECADMKSCGKVIHVRVLATRAVQTPTVGRQNSGHNERIDEGGTQILIGALQTQAEWSMHISRANMCYLDVWRLRCRERTNIHRKGRIRWTKNSCADVQAANWQLAMWNYGGP